MSTYHATDAYCTINPACVSTIVDFRNAETKKEKNSKPINTANQPYPRAAGVRHHRLRILSHYRRCTSAYNIVA